MAIRSRIFPSDEELGKRDDDLEKKQPNGWLPRSSKTPLLRRKRVLGLVVALICVYLFVHNLPQSALGERRMQRRARPEPREPANNGEDLWRQAQQAQDDDVPDAIAPSEQEGNAQDYDGPIRFYYLAASLHGAAKVSGQRASNKNILFAAADLKSAADLVPMACEMSRWKRNNVHLAVMGRDAVPLDEIKKVNGAEDESTCNIFWHDARPDFARRSTTHRMEVSVAGAIGHIENFMHPQAVITNYPEHEDDFFVRAVARKTKELSQTHIELPKGASESLSWMSRLDATALLNWHAAAIDIVVQAPQDTSSNIVRLLKSLERADYGGFLPPRLTVELPHKMNQDTMVFLDEFQWPPRRYQNHLPYHELVLHRRIPEKRLTDYEASTRFMESFYPSDTMNSHVLVLSPQAELSPTFFHYLKYHMLEYRYSDYAADMFGISLETPASYLNGSESFVPPQKKTRDSRDDDREPAMPFLWQAPNTGAALIFADKWIELHSFLTQYFIASADPLTKPFFDRRSKQVSEKLPSWAEYLLDLMRARGYYFLFPGTVSENSGGTSLAVLHNDMYQVPEEFLKPFVKQDSDPNNLPNGDVLEGSDTAYLSNHHVSSEKDALTIERPLLRNLLAVLPSVPASVAHPSQSDDERPEAMPDVLSLPLIDHSGVGVSPDNLRERSEDWTLKYRQDAGGCTEHEAKDVAVVHGNAEDLFCVGEEHEDHEHAKVKPPSVKEGTRADRIERASKPKTDDDDDEAADGKKATPTHQELRGTGAAANVNAAKDPDGYAATAVAGFKDKLKSGKHYEDEIPVININEKALTDEERRELNSIRGKWRDPEAKGKLGAPPPEHSRQDDEEEAERADRLEPVIDEREYERTDEDAPEKPKPTETEVERPTAAGSRPDHTDDAVNAETADVTAARNSKQRQQSEEDDEDESPRGRSNLPDEAADAAIGGRDGRSFKKGRIGGWDIGGYDEAIIDERAAGAGRLDFARNRGRKQEEKRSEDQIKADLAAGRSDTGRRQVLPEGSLEDDIQEPQRRHGG